MGRHIVFVNPRSGARKDPRRVARVRRAMQAEGLRAEYEVVEGHDVARVVAGRARESPKSIIVAGGDGTVSSAAGALAGSRVPLGILPLGTRNHFAKDLGLPWRLRPAARVIARSHVAPVDVAEVNGGSFVNNVSIGLYPRIVVDREAQRERWGRNKVLASAYAAASTVRRNRRLRVRLETRHRAMYALTPFVFVGNNPYEFERFRLGRRRSLDSGRLGIYLAGPVSRASLLAMPFRALVGRLHAAQDFRAFHTREAFVETDRESVRVAVDGEIRRLRPPLHFRARPRALRVLSARGRAR